MRNTPQTLLKVNTSPNLNDLGKIKVNPYLTHKRGLNGLGLSHNKKGFTQWIFVGVAMALLLGFILFSKGVFGSPTLHSLTPKSAGYTPEKCKDLGVVVGGFVNVEDSGWTTLNPSLRSIDVDEVLVDGKNTLCFFCAEANFRYVVTGTDSVSGSLDSYKGTGTLRGADNKGISQPFSLNYVIPDNNCDGRIDSFNLELKAELKGDEVGKKTTLTKLIRVRDGQIQ